MKPNTDFNRTKLKNNQLYLPLSGGQVNGKTIFTNKVDLGGDGKNAVKIKNGMIQSGNACYFGTCKADQASQQIKDVKLTDVTEFSLRPGASIGVKFEADNTFSASASNPIMLNVNGTGGKQVYYQNTATPTGTNNAVFGMADYVIYYRYDGTYWVWEGVTDTVTAAEKKAWNQSLANEAPIELGATATTTHSAGTYIIYGANRQFAKVVAAIAIGDAFNNGTGGNVTDIDIGSVLTALNTQLMTCSQNITTIQTRLNRASSYAGRTSAINIPTGSPTQFASIKIPEDGLYYIYCRFRATSYVTNGVFRIYVVGSHFNPINYECDSDVPTFFMGHICYLAKNTTITALAGYATAAIAFSGDGNTGIGYVKLN